MSQQLSDIFRDGNWLWEDQLPKSYPYHEMFPFSKLGPDGLGGARVFPDIQPLLAAPPEIDRLRAELSASQKLSGELAEALRKYCEKEEK